ncbi:putative transcription factor interactor and regulator CCHC(Zn) family [Helianthus annuus]|nr:putative transcription factor interactor and regulator CCHC(Zn) family [Helianthus annuus]KAJ0821311.1 putative transcription factor interactor and regulator CCHC(Zn) family [Helianthus annuus]
MSEAWRDRRQGHRFAAGGSGPDRRDPRDIEIERLNQRIRDLEFNQQQFHNLHHPERDDEERTETESVVWDRYDGYHDYDEDFHNVFAGRDQRPPPQRRPRQPQLPTDPIRALGLRTKIPEFEGRLHPDEFVDWLHTVERIFDLRQVPEELKLRMRCDLDEDEENVIARFLGALKPEISDAVHLQQFWSFDDVCQLAKRVEKQLLSRPKPSTRFAGNMPSASAQVPPKAEQPKPPASGPVIVPTPAQTNSQRCYKCNGIGHLKWECPNKQVVALLDEPPPTFDEEPDNVDDEPHASEVVYPDKGEALVVQRLLHTEPTPSSDDTAWLRTTIFRTRCTSKSKICNVIIDGGSCENIVSQTMVDKLKLPLHDHPAPYQLTWLKKGNILKVSHRCLVQFSIGDKYSDEVWCEVLPMDACHILLGRPWQYDRRAKHDGFRNMYSFKKDGVNITLAPCDPRKDGPCRCW